MRILRIFLSFLLGLVLLFNINIYAFADIEPEELGDRFGYNDGFYEGYRYFNAKDEVPNYKELLDLYEIEEKYSEYLMNQSSDYRFRFISAYFSGFERGYNEALQGKNTSEDTNSITSYEDYADILGLLMGEIYGLKDCYWNKNANPNNALPSNSTIVEMFNLNSLNSQARHSFINTFKSKFKEGYEEGYASANFEPIRISYDKGLSHGEYFGNIMGKNHGAKDYFEGKTSNYKRNFPSDSSIIREFTLNNDGKEYREGFLIGFRRAYEESYNESYRTMNMEIHKRDFEKGYDHGKDAGIIKGESKAYEDFHFRLENNWRRHYPSQGSLLREYSLHLDSKRYREGFFSGFIDGLAEGYANKYQGLEEEIIKVKTKTEELPISGGEIVSLDGGLKIKIHKGTYFNPIIITIDNLPDDYYSVGKDYIKASNYYRINIFNKSNEVDNKKDIELQFEYYGRDNGGIYKLSNEQWLYIPSRIEDGNIKTSIKPNSLKKGDNVYSVLIDKNYNILLDIRSHWGKEEIIVFQRRGIVSGYTDNTFKPDKNISKNEFLTLLSRVYKWEIKENQDGICFKNLLKYAQGKGYVDNWKEDLETANEGISYREIDSIMRKVLRSDNFHWSNISAKILYEKNYRSKYYNNPDNYITRAEVVYMLYTLNEWRY